MVFVAAVVCPGAPFLIAEAAEALANRAQPVRDACLAALAGLPISDAVLLLTSAGVRASAGANAADAPDSSRNPRLLPPGSVVRSNSVRRSDSAGTLTIAAPTADVDPQHVADAIGVEVDDPAVGTVVGAQLLSDASIVAPTTAVEVTDPAAAVLLLAGHAASTERLTLLVIAGGSACHGDGAPGRRDDRAAAFDRALADALADGVPDRLARACADRELAENLMADVIPLRVLASLTEQRPPASADLLYSGAPFGVGYLVARWQWIGS